MYRQEMTDFLQNKETLNVPKVLTFVDSKPIENSRSSAAELWKDKHNWEGACVYDRTYSFISDCDFRKMYARVRNLIS